MSARSSPNQWLALIALAFAAASIFPSRLDAASLISSPVPEFSRIGGSFCEKPSSSFSCSERTYAALSGPAIVKPAENSLSPPGGLSAKGPPMTVTTVTNTTEFENAVYGAHAGDTILLAAGSYTPLSMNGLNFSGAVNIQSQDPTHQAVVSGLYVTNSSGLNFSNLELSTAGNADYYPLRVTSSSNVNFSQLNVHGSMDGIANDLSGFYISQSSNVSVANSDFHDLLNAITYGDSNSLVFSSNSFHDIQSDGIQGWGTSNLTITRNSFKNFHPNAADHPDAISLWISAANPAIHGITISDNVITQGTGGKIQGIWLDTGGTTPLTPTSAFTDVTMTGNQFFGTMYNGLGIVNANHVNISNNVVQGYPDMESWIRVENSDSVSLTNNQSQTYVFKADTNLSESGDQTVGPADPNSITTGSTTTGGSTSTGSTTPSEPDAVTSPVTYTLGPNSHSLTLSGTADIDGTGNDNGDTITGNTGSNHLTGGAGADTIADGGGAGADTMAGAAGNDTYYVNNSADAIVENSGAGTDTVNASVTYTLSPNVEKLVLTGTANIDGTGNDNGDAITGNVGANHLTGGAGADTISDGGVGGADTMAGKVGDDTYYVNNSADVITENAVEGTDTVISSVTYKLSANVENLVLTGNANIDGTAGGTGSHLTGNTGANHLYGGAGNDSLDGGAGADTMSGGAGNDTYTVDNSSDSIVEKSGQGQDLVQALVSYTLGSNVEDLVLVGSSAINGNGNALANHLTGNSAANRLDGDVGDDTVDGGGGNDTIFGGAGNDSLTGGAGADVFKFALHSGHDVITDFKANGDADQIDISAYTTHRYAPTITDHGAYTTVSFSTGDSIDLLGVHASDLHLDHGLLF